MNPSALIFFAFLSAFISDSLADEHSSNWRSDSRRWIGPDWWANPLQDWSLQSGQATTFAGINRSLCLTSFSIVTTSNPVIFEMSVTVYVRGPVGRLTSAGFRIGRRGPNPHWMSSLVDANKFIEASIFSTGVQKVGRKSMQIPFRFWQNKLITLTLKASQGTTPNMTRLELATSYGTVSAKVKKINILGELALFTGGPDMRYRNVPVYVHFANFSIKGPGVRDSAEHRQLGPILWTQYTLSENVLRLQAQLMPLENYGKTVKAELWTRRDRLTNGDAYTWGKAARATMHPYARTATFTVPNWNSKKSTPYAVRVMWNGRMYSRCGRVRSEPKRDILRLAVFSCDEGYVFPQHALVEQVQRQNPDVLVFLGDQIYESYGGFGTRLFGSVPESVLDYLR